MTLSSRLRLPSSVDDWSAHLLATWGLRVASPTTAAPLRLVATTPGGLVVTLTGAGTSLRLALHEPAALRTVLVRPDCDCGADHGGAVALRVELDPLAVPRWEHRVDGRARHGWRSVEAARLDLGTAAAYLDRLLAAHAPVLAMHGWEPRPTVDRAA